MAASSTFYIKKVYLLTTSYNWASAEFYALALHGQRTKGLTFKLKILSLYKTRIYNEISSLLMLLAAYTFPFISFKNHLLFTFVKTQYFEQPVPPILNQFTDNQFCQYNTRENNGGLWLNVTSYISYIYSFMEKKILRASSLINKNRSFSLADTQ